QDALAGNYKAVPGKYELIETDNSDPEVDIAVAAGGDGSGAPARPARLIPCTLDPPTKELVELTVIGEDMFKSAMTKMNVDVKKMPLGRLSKTQA
ncbi:unnamed protein product, partial [Discosporangium mesarthrocarpum]